MVIILDFSMLSSLTIATRQSPLALCQANWVKARLEILYPQLTVHLLGLTTSGDKQSPTSLSAAGGKGLFVKELEDALLQGRADIAVHSMKDVPMELPAGLCLPVIMEREDPRDALVANDFQNLAELPAGAKVGTSSLRRQAQLRALHPELQVEDLRGNVETRIARLDRGDFAAIILAVAGLKRLNLQARIRAFFNTDESLPAPGQGALGIECRENAPDIQRLIAALNDPDTFACVSAERALCKYLGGGCHVPIAAYAVKEQEKIVLRGLVGRTDGMVILRAQHSSADHAEKLGITVAKDLLNQGAGKILNL
jgi:hydroxymethylbilane synthase